jgi:gas vesicle protein GvpL/GvpF
VFCLVQSDRAPSVRGVPKGIPGGGAPRALAVDRGLWAIVADAPLDRFSGEQLQQELQDVEAVSRHALAHASIVEFFFQRGTVIPLKLFTLFSQDERARRQLAKRKTQLRRLFAELRGFEEWGVRIIGALEPAPASRAPVITGRDYLEVKKRLRDEASAPPRATLKDVQGGLKTLSRLASKTRKDKFPPAGQGRPYVTGASFLVKAKRRAQWKRQVAQLAARLEKRDHRLEMSGPWPPYHFVSR